MGVNLQSRAGQQGNMVWPGRCAHPDAAPRRGAGKKLRPKPQRAGSARRLQADQIRRPRDSAPEHQISKERSEMGIALGPDYPGNVYVAGTTSSTG